MVWLIICFIAGAWVINWATADRVYTGTDLQFTASLSQFVQIRDRGAVFSDTDGGYFTIKNAQGERLFGKLTPANLAGGRLLVGAGRPRIHLTSPDGEPISARLVMYEEDKEMVSLVFKIIIILNALCGAVLILVLAEVISARRIQQQRPGV